MSSHEHTTTITQRLSVIRPGSIRTKILVLAVVATLLPSLTTAWISYAENKRSLTAKASEELSSASMQTARELELWVKERRYELRVFASSYEVTENLERIPRVRGEAVRSGRAHQRLTDYLKSVSERFGDYEELVIVDAHGHLVASSGEDPAAPVLPADWDAQVRGDGLALGEPRRNAATGRTEMLIGVQIGAAAGEALGTLTAKANLRALASKLKRFAPGNSGAVHLLTERGTLILSSDARAGANAAPYPAQAIRAYLAREGRQVELTDAQGTDVLGSARRVPGVEWIVVAEIPSAEVFRQLGSLRNVTLLIMAGMLAVAGGLGYALGLFIVRPLDRLTRGAAKVAAGDLDVDLPVATGGEVGYLTRVFNNMVARLRASHSELERLSVTDHLTGLYNRRRMMEVLEDEVRRSRRLRHTFAVLMADVDHFKRYNDAHGHPAGDEVLKRVAAILREMTRDVDFVARYGGEEFFVLLPETDAGRAAALAQSVRARLAKERLPAGTVTLSFGVAEFPAHGTSGDALIAAADALLYQAKRDGRDQVVVAPKAARASAAGR